MSEWRFTDDRALMMGMGLTMVMLLLVFVVFVSLLIAVGIPWYLVIGAAVGVGLFHYFVQDRVILSNIGGRIVSAEEAPDLHNVLGRLAAMADIPSPKKVAIIESEIPNAFAAGRNPSNAVVAVTTGLMRRLDEQELEAVLAHEISHVKNRDIMVMTLAMIVIHLTQYLMVFLRWSFVVVGAVTAALLAFGSRNVLVYLAVIMIALTLYVYMGIAYIALAVIQFFNNLFMLALGRCREYAADRGAATLSGAPMHLASALQKIDDEISLIPEEDLRGIEKANAFLIIPAIKRNFVTSFLSSHPRTEKRIRKLQEMQGEIERSN